jgi:outer membrane protein OmpA-like peptidoglycan-associated protein
MPTGDSIESNEFKSFLDDLAEVISQGKLNVIIEVYSTPIGGVKANLKTTATRADAIKHYLINTKKVVEDQIEVVGKGSWSSSRSSGNEISPPSQDQSKAMIRVRVR